MLGRGGQVIHYHGTPVGGSRQDVARFLQGRHALIPFFRQEDLGIAAEVCKSFVFDNSAFSVWKTGGCLMCLGTLSGSATGAATPDLHGR